MPAGYGEVVPGIVVAVFWSSRLILEPRML